MCGRFVVSYTYDELVQFLETSFDPFVIKHQLRIPDYNIAPSKHITSMVFDGEQYRIGQLKWGFKPFERFKYPLINVRSETIDDKPIYRHAFHSRRCIIFANGFYEWQTNGVKKLPHYIYPNKQSIWLFAGIFAKLEDQSNQPEYTTAILTKAAQSNLQVLHERMPVILSVEEAKIWLDQSSSKEHLISLFQKDSVDLKFHPVSLQVNNAHQNSIDNIKRVSDA
jgi:putative SOS response-associated peptidase YedK